MNVLGKFCASCIANGYPCFFLTTYKPSSSRCEHKCMNGMYGPYCGHSCQCKNGGSCDENGRCVCPAGYKGQSASHVSLVEFCSRAILVFTRNQGGSRIFSRGADFQKFCRPFFSCRSTKLIFRIASKSTKNSLFWPNFVRRRQNFAKKKQANKGVFRHFLENVDQKIVFFWRALPLKRRL